MASLQLVEGLIGTICAIACLYYARQGALAGPEEYMSSTAPWHSALGEYARRNPFAAVFGALALGFLISSWSMYALPRPAGIAPREIEKWHTVTKVVRAPDPAEAAKIASLQATINTDAATIAAQSAQIDSLKQLLAKSPRRGRRSAAAIGANPANANANPEGTAADLNRTYNPVPAALPASAPPSAPVQTTATPPAQAPAAGTPNGASQDSSTTPPH